MFGNIFQAQRDLENWMKEIQKQIIEQGNNEQIQEEEKRIKQQLEERYAQEETLWQQKSRVQWLKEGEKNTIFFHRSTIQRRHINRITKLEDAQG